MAEDLLFENRMSDADALMWTIEADPVLRSTITAVCMLDRSPDRQTLIERSERSARLVPRLQQRVISNPFSVAPPRWEFDPNFDLDYHLRFVKAPGEGTLDDVLRMAEPIAMQGFDRARPLWEMYVVDGLADGGAATILKIHHAITDGVGAVKIAMVLFDLEREPGDLGPMPAAPEIHVMDQRERILDAARHEGRRQLGILRRIPDTISNAAAGVVADPAAALAQVAATAGSVARMLAPATTPGSTLMSNRSLSVHFDTIELPLDATKAAAKKAGGRLNDAFVAGVLGGLRRYHDKHGASAEQLRMTMPINIRDESTANVAGNQFAPSRFFVPLTIDDPVERMVAVRDLVAVQRAEPALNLLDPLAGILRRLPTFASTGIFGSLLRGVDFVTTNVPGVPVPVYVAGAQITAQYAFGPMSGAAANIALLSYLDRVQIGVNSDSAAVTDPALFHACLVDGFDEILSVAS